ncbi:MAG: NYN domain-containing protein [Oscillospiraceae bacterium]|nr:NYN domain-containing protein [Oscillospiraceae bacterium]
MENLSECLILVDNSNVWIEGMKFSARRQGILRGPLDDKDPQNWNWRIDFGSLLREVANRHKIIQAILVGSEPPPNDTVWNAARQQGFEVITYQRGQAGEKSVDTELVARGLEVIYRYKYVEKRPAVLKLLSGDRDFVPLIQTAYREGWETELWGFGVSLSVELAQMANRVHTLDDVFDRIGK